MATASEGMRARHKGANENFSRQGRLGSSWPRCGRRKDAALCACETEWEAALCACEADVGKVVCVCGGFGRPGRAGLSRDSGRAAGKAGSEEDVARDGTEPVRKGGHGSRRTRPGATQRKRKRGDGWVGSRKRVDVGKGKLDAGGDVEGRANRIDVAMQIRWRLQK
ncbi:hypothetical protein B0H14DRAFT_2590735 [Mycena olivaceomarginata]|nr:hypothetical protein B0H14DRAFT_2590735 [Mycena olivaceomarginata]